MSLYGGFAAVAASSWQRGALAAHCRSAASAAPRRCFAAAAAASGVGERCYDAIIIGGGHNGLIAAAYLARSGARVAVLERRAVLGGAAVTEAAQVPGVGAVQFSRASYVYSLFRPHIAADLALHARGLALLRRSPSSFSPSPEAGGRSLTLGGGDAFDAAGIAAFSKRDAAAWRGYNATLERYASFARYALDVAPPDLARMLGGDGASLRARGREAAGALRLAAAAARTLGGAAPDFASFLAAPAARFLDSWFEGDLLKATLATDAVIGALASPQSPGSAYVLLHHVMCGSWFNVVGGMGGVSAALAAACAAHGVALAPGVRAARLLLRADGRGVAGVEDAAGRAWRAPLVLSSAAPTLTLGEGGLLPADAAAALLPRRAAAALAAVDSASGVVKINVALDALPRFRCRLPGEDARLAALLAPPPRARGEVAPTAAAAATAPLHLRGTIHFEPDMAVIDAAYRDVAAGSGASARPLVEMTLPSVLDGSLAPAGSHVALLFCQYAPPAHSPHWRRAGAREDFADAAFRVIEEYAPGFTASVRYREVLAPPDLEAQFALPGGNIFHGAMSLDQLFTGRPVPGLASYRTPVEGLYLCGAGTHPGGGVMGAPGHNAALQALADAGWSRAALRRISSCPTLRGGLGGLLPPQQLVDEAR